MSRPLLSARKEQIYAEALAEGLKDGALTPVERSILDRLRTSLELEEDVVRDLEARISGEVGGPDPAAATR